jgi:pimeloyl-ACP methyl ester carboxylesterase
VTFDFATINGHRLRYHLAGEGPLAVFGHGLLGSIESVNDHLGTLDPLRERLRLLLYDARGHGQSEGPADLEGYTWETLGRDMAAFAGHFGAERALFGGGSMGAAAALWVALEQPERVRALVLVMPPPLGPPEIRGPEEKQAIAMLEMLAAAVLNFGVEKTAELARNMPGLSTSAEDMDARERWILAQNPLALTHAIRGVIQAPFHDPECYRAIRVPTLVLAHEGDGLHPARAAKLVGDRVPGCRVRIGDSPDYWRAHPDEFIAEVSTFLDRVG